MKSEHITFSDIIIISWLPFITFQVLTTQTYHFSYHYESRFCDILRYFTRFSLSTSNAFHHLSIKHFHHFPVLTSHDERLAFVYNLKDVELQVLFEQMLDFTGFSGTRFLILPLAYHSYFRYIKFAIRSISSVSVLSRTWQYRSIVICKEL